MDEWDMTMPYLNQNDVSSIELKDLALLVVILDGTQNIMIILSSRNSIITLSVAFWWVLLLPTCWTSQLSLGSKKIHCLNCLWISQWNQSPTTGKGITPQLVAKARLPTFDFPWITGIEEKSLQTCVHLRIMRASNNLL